MPIILPTTQKAIDEGAYYDEAKAERQVKFFREQLWLSTSVKPFVPLPWQEDILRYAYGWYRSDGTRLIRKILISSAKKCGKSAFAAGLSVNHLVAQGVQNPYVIIGACAQQQAGELFRECVYSMKQNDALRQALHSRESQYLLEYPAKFGRLKAISWDAATKGGVNASFVCLDECALHPNSTLYDMLKSSMMARKEPMMVLLSNAGWDKAHWYYSEYQDAKAVLTGDNDDTSILPCIWEVPEDKSWEEEDNWYLANPSLGTVIDIEVYRSEYKKAKRNKSHEMHYRQFYCSQWTPKRTAWIDLAEWDKCKADFPDLSKERLWIGCDLSQTQDLTAVCAVYPIADKFYVRSYNFAPRASLERRAKQNLSDYTQFEYDGSLKISTGNCIEFEAVRNCIKGIPGKCEAIIIDRKFANETSLMLEKDGYKVYNFPQWYSYYNEVCRKFETLVMDRKIVHDGNTCLRWCLNNTELSRDSKDYVMPGKGSEHAKNDAVCAMLMALSQAMLHDAMPVAPPSVYTRRGILVFS